MKRRRILLGSSGPLPGFITQHPSPNTVTYNGQEHELCTAGSGSGTMLYSKDGVSFSSSIPTEINAGTYIVYYKADASPSYAESSVYQISCTINKAAGSVSVAPTNKNVTYNGTAQDIVNAGSGTGTMYYRVGSSGDFSTAIPKQTNANGSYTVYYYAAESNNYAQSPTGSITATIGQREITLIWGTASWTYDKTAHSTTCTAGNLISGDSCTVDLTGNSITNVGSTTVTASSLSNSNYKLPSANTKSISVEARTVTLTWGTVTWTYDKTEHSTTCTAGNLCSGDTCTVNLTGNSITNQGTTTVTASSLSNSNYTLPSSKTNTLTINAKTVTLTWGTTSWTYDKTAHSTTCTAGDLCSGDSCTVTLIGNSITNVGSTTVTASSLSNSNYALPSANTKSISVGARTVTLTWGTITWTYDGTAHGTTCTAGNLCSGDSCTVTLTGNSITNKGTTTVTASSLSNSNYALPSSKTNTLTINARTVTLTWGTITWTYDKAAHSTTCTAGNLCLGDSCTVTLTGNSITNKGTTTVTASSLSNSNYALPSSKTATLTINARTVTLTWGTLTWTYDGKTHYTTCTAGNVCSGDSCTVNLSGNSVGATVGTATVTASSLSNSNYTLPSSKTAKLTINKAAGGATVSGVSLTFNNSSRNLVTVSNNTGTMYYRVGTSGSWTTTTPTSTNVGSWTIYYYVAASTNYTAAGSSSSPQGYVSSSIGKANQSAPTATGATTTYPTTATATASGGGGVGTLTWTNGNSLTSVGSKKTKAYWAGNGNYNASPYSNEVTVLMNKAAGSVSTAPTATNPSYTGGAVALVNAGSGTGTMYYRVGTSGSFSTTIPTATAAGTYTIYYYAAASTNYNLSATGSVTSTISYVVGTTPTNLGNILTANISRNGLYIVDISYIFNSSRNIVLINKSPYTYEALVIIRKKDGGPTIDVTNSYSLAVVNFSSGSSLGNGFYSHSISGALGRINVFDRSHTTGTSVLDFIIMNTHATVTINWT